MEKQEEDRIEELSKKVDMLVNALEREKSKKIRLPSLKKYITKENVELILSITAFVISASVAAIVLLDL